jgi:hypothetical protein
MTATVIMANLLMAFDLSPAPHGPFLSSPLFDQTLRALLECWSEAMSFPAWKSQAQF